MKDISLSGGSQLAFYMNDGKKIETEEEKTAQQEQIRESVKSTVSKSEFRNEELGIDDIEAAKLRYLQRKGLI